ncbi:MAG: isoleucine--tRNA ligase [Chloroflexi bacterium]|nr:isoleucine--tRNA ligase [Chloroflexota bacterium]
MPFQSVPATVDLVELEHKMLGLWRESKTFEQLRELHRGEPHWSFIDGPITANNPMGVHHGWGRTYKDVYSRFWTMRGRELRYQNGFDCQGLWVEVEVEKELGFESRKDIEAFGLAAFVNRCKQRVLRMAALQTEQSIRLGFWMDWNDPDTLRELADKLDEDPQQIVTVNGPQGPVTDAVERIVGRLGLPELGGSYFTFSTENNYMIWTMLKKCWEQGWIYRGADVMPWCPRCSTAISQHEIVTDGYAELTHDAVTLRFPLRERPGEALLVWTTTPWTLTSNVAAAVGPELTYVKVRNGEQILYLSKGTLSMLEGPVEVLAELKGTDLVGWTYDGPFDDLPAAQRPGGLTPVPGATAGVELTAVQAHQVILWDAVGEEEGTGIVHIAPGCGAEDYQLGREHKLPMLAPLDDEGYFVEGFGWLTGKQVHEVAHEIFHDLDDRGLLYHVRGYTHRYPICWRCKTPLVFRLVDEWFISMDELRYKMMDVTRQIRWIPSFGLERELDWLRNMHDWMISKKRYWGLALPIWECAACGHFHVVGDEEELRQRAVAGWETFEGHTPHRPYVDAVKIACDKCGAEMSRVSDVGNPWLDAGIVSFSTLQYRTNKDYWREWYPAHWISESFPGQFRNWFYSLLAMATVLEGTPPFLQNFSYATLLAEDGSPMHKSSGNMIPFDEAADRMGVDVMRWLFCAHKPENNLMFGYNRADDVRRRFILPLWNVYKFLTTYALLDGWQPSTEGFDPKRPEGQAPASDSPLDRWIIARINEVVVICTDRLENSDSLGATLAVEAFVDDLTNWYIRRSRRRYWKSEADLDKQMAYATLYYAFVRLIRILAPIVPFITEAMYQNLVRSVQPAAFESVHHTYWPEIEECAVDQELLQQMSLAREIASLGLGARGSVNIKVRQPLSRALVFAESTRGGLSPELIEIVADELNVKSLAFVDEEGQLVQYRLVADGRQLGPKLGKAFPQVRAALAETDAAAAVRRINAGLPVELTVGGEVVSIAPEEIIVHADPAEGLAVASDKGVTVAIDAVITPELEAEGQVRDLVRYVQTLRKDADYELDQRITVGLFGLDDAAAEAVQALRDYILQETLCVTLLLSDDGGEWDQRQAFKLNGEPVEVAVRR